MFWYSKGPASLDRTWRLLREHLRLRSAAHDPGSACARQSGDVVAAGSGLLFGHTLESEPLVFVEAAEACLRSESRLVLARPRRREDVWDFSRPQLLADSGETRLPAAGGADFDCSEVGLVLAGTGAFLDEAELLVPRRQRGASVVLEVRFEETRLLVVAWRWSLEVRRLRPNRGANLDLREVLLHRGDVREVRCGAGRLRLDIELASGILLEPDGGEALEGVRGRSVGAWSWRLEQSAVERVELRSHEVSRSVFWSREGTAGRDSSVV